MAPFSVFGGVRCSTQSVPISGPTQLSGLLAHWGGEIGRDHTIGGNPGAYSFNREDPDLAASSDTSLCLMLSVIDWSLGGRGKGRFMVIIDLPQIFDPDSSADGLACSTATMGEPILEFQGTDFTTGDAGIVGSNARRGKTGGLWIYDLGTGTRTRIIGDGVSPDWSN